MKRFIYKFSDIFSSPLIRDCFFARKLRWPTYALMLLMTLSFSSCFKQYYQPNTQGKADAVNLSKLQAENRFFIVHTPDGIYALNNQKVEGNILSGSLSPLAPPHDKYINPRIDRTNDFKRIDKAVVLSEVHVYTNMSCDSNGHLDLPVNQIFRLDVYEMDKATTRQAFVGSLILIVGIPTAIIVAGAAMPMNFGTGFHLNL